MRSIIVLMSIVFLGGGISAQDMRISLDRVDTLINGKLPHDYPISFYFRMTNTSIHDINGLSSGFRIYSPDGATWSAGFFVDTVLTCDFSPVVCYDTTFCRVPIPGNTRSRRYLTVVFSWSGIRSTGQHRIRLVSQLTHKVLDPAFSPVLTMSRSGSSCRKFRTAVSAKQFVWTVPFSLHRAGGYGQIAAIMSLSGTGHVAGPFQRLNRRHFRRRRCR